MGGAPVFHAYADQGRRIACARNAVSGGCNWLVPEEDGDIFCTCCRHNRVVPDLTLPWNLTAGGRSRRPSTGCSTRSCASNCRWPPARSTRTGFAFDFLVDPSETSGGGPPVLTGHINGLITMNIAEADDVERERRRILFGEHYRTLLGHFRTRSGTTLVLAGDEQPVPGLIPGAVRGREPELCAALQAHYAGGAPADWEESYVSAYATAHPWEDFAETFAHYLHIVDTIETASTSSCTCARACAAPSVRCPRPRR